MLWWSLSEQAKLQKYLPFRMCYSVSKERLPSMQWFSCTPNFFKSQIRLVRSSFWHTQNNMEADRKLFEQWLCSINSSWLIQNRYRWPESELDTVLLRRLDTYCSHLEKQWNPTLNFICFLLLHIFHAIRARLMHCINFYNANGGTTLPWFHAPLYKAKNSLNTFKFMIFFMLYSEFS